MNKLSLTADEAREILWNDNKEFKIIKNEIVDTTRWSVIHELTVQHISGKYYQDCYSVGATECQDESPWEYDEPNFVEVIPVEETIIVYKVVE